MSFLFENVRINRIVVHEIFARDETGAMTPPRFSQALSDLEGAGLEELRQRLTAALGSDSRSVEMEVADDDEGSTFQLCSQLPRTMNASFLEQSMKIAQRLANAQTSRRIPGGVVVVIDGTTGRENRHFSAVIKAEVHSGFRKESTGDGTLIRFLNDLLLTPKQKLYKIGAFIELQDPVDEEETRSPEEFSVYVYDSQMTAAERGKGANYFRETFLGCRIAPSARKRTKDFFFATKKFIQSSDLDEDAKLECTTALTVYLRSNSALIHVADFADTYLPTDLKQSYADHMEAEDFPTNAVPKDTAHIKSQLRTRRLTFTNEVKILGPADRFSKLVQVESRGEDHTVVRISGRIRDAT